MAEVQYDLAECAFQTGEMAGGRQEIAGPEGGLGQVVLPLGHLGLGRAERVAQAPQRDLRFGEVAMMQQVARPSELRHGIEGGLHAGPVVARGHGQGPADTEHATHCPHGCLGGAGDGASALPIALILSCTWRVNVSPGAPPASACWYLSSPPATPPCATF